VAGIDQLCQTAKMMCMKTTEITKPGDRSQALLDAQCAADSVAAGVPIPSDVALRIRQRADQARQEVLARHGVQDIGVGIIREIRGELPEP
jgi:hypothetical protein